MSSTMPLSASSAEYAATAAAKGGDAPLEGLSRAMAGDMEAVNRIIIEKMQSPVTLIPQLGGYIVAAGGKRLRPLLTVACARMCGHTGTRHHMLAACVEFIHTATLLHDDVVDESDLRRGQASANEIYGNKASVLVGDFLFSRAFELMVADGSSTNGSLDVLRILSNASMVIAEGEVLQLMTTQDIETTEDAYLKVIESKTAVLFAAACEIGPVVAGCSDDEIAAMRAFGMNLGVAFQIVDDILDYSAERASLGKAIGDDFREGKMTLPVVYALAAANDEERAFWERTMGRLEQQPGDLEQAISIMNRHQAMERSMLKARGYGHLAKDALMRWERGEIRDLLLNTVDFTVSRSY